MDLLFENENPFSEINEEKFFIKRIFRSIKFARVSKESFESGDEASN